MKTINFTLILCILPALLFAKGPGGGTGQMGRQSNRGSMHEAISAGGPNGVSSAGMSTLYQFLSMDDESLEQLEATIRRIRQMTPEERAAFQEKIIEYHQMPSEDRQQIQQAWGHLDATVRSAWREYMMGLEPEERDKVRQEMHRIPAEDRTRWRIELLKEAGLLDDEEIDE